MSHFDACRFILVFVNVLCLGFGFDFTAFDDNNLFRIVWPGSDGPDPFDKASEEIYTITSPNKEQYQCLIPNVSDLQLLKEKEYTGKNPIEVLKPLFEPSICSFRLESYWTYELCHGRFVLQYHEERDGKKSQIQKYELGKFDLSQLKLLSEQYNKLAHTPNRKLKIPVKKIDGINMPYVEVEMTNGSLCDINNEPRSIKVFYICHHHEKHEIYSIKEVALCEYEAIVKTPWLCQHPDYKLQDTEENKIICKPLGKAPKKPRALITMEAERVKMRHQKLAESKQQKVFAIFHVDQDGQDGQPQLRVEIHPMESNKLFSLNNLNQVNHAYKVLKISKIQQFLNGDNCLLGGIGWWKFEFCYGRSVSQYHLEQDGTKTVIDLGKFDEENHKQWLIENPDKKPKLQKAKIVRYLYSKGSICKEINKPRQTEVHMKCLPNLNGIDYYSVSMMLKEQKTCEYELTVFSEMFCDLLEFADHETGIITVDKNAINEDKISNLREKDDEEMVANKDEL